MQLEPVHQLILDFITHTNTPIFMTGKAGTGKTTFLHYIKNTIKKNLAVVAPTAVAAINAGGVTIHSFFQVPFGPLMPTSKSATFAEFTEKNFSPDKAKLIKCLELLVIDEISMVRADTMDYIDRVLQVIKGSTRPFGGIQLLMIGDLYQLSPVYQNEWHLLRKFYAGPYFFDSLVFRQFPMRTFELTKVHRQKDTSFIEILNSIRNGSITDSLLDQLNERYRPIPEDEELSDYVTLTTHNPLVKQINELRLDELPGTAHRFKAKINGDFPKDAFPAEEELVLKVGALVMFIKNDPSGKKLFYNGKTAKITSIAGNSIKVEFLDDQSEFEVTQETWENVKYSLSETDHKVSESSSGSFIQFPIRLARAITIHKSQGLTFDKAVVDVGAAFAHGQTYVALSRCRSLEGLILKEKVKPANIITDRLVIGFMKNAEENSPDSAALEKTISQLGIEVLKDIFDFSMLQNAWNYLKLILSEPPILAPQLKEKIESSQQLLEDKIKKIGDRFIKQELINNTELDVLNSSSLKERLEKASGYFLGNLISVEENINDLHELASGSEQHENYYPTVNQFLEQLTTKIMLFKSLPTAKSNVEIVDVLKNAAISYQPIDRWNKKEIVKEKEIVNRPLYDELVKWRTQISLRKKSPDYTILSEQVMADISAKTPRSLKQLSMIKNFGEGKTAEFGEEILRIIRAHLGENDLFS